MIRMVTFLKMPCAGILCKHNLKRFHFTCLTCRTRRWHYRKLSRKKWMRGNLVIMMEPNPKGTFILPRTDTRIRIVILNPYRKLSPIKNFFLHIVRTIEEFLMN